MKQAKALLSQIFGFSDFRPGQEEIVSSIQSGRDVLAIMPTGGGKSLCFQLPALTRDGVTVVISPLIALMRDQVRALRENGVEAGALTSQTDPEEVDDIMQKLRAGTLKLLYMAPERLGSGYTTSLLRNSNVSLLAVDEAHCVSQWGHDFRPDYLRIGGLRRDIGPVQTIALTATADAETRSQIIAQLFPEQEPEVFLQGFDRPNLFISFKPKNKPRDQILEFANQHKGLSGIVYCASRAKTETLAKGLNDAGHNAMPYHAGLESSDRQRAEARFQREDGLIVCATIAFGMGVDKPDIRFVAHADLSKSVEAYYQEIGRAGRDGAPAATLTLYGAEDIRLRRSQIDEGAAPVDRKEADHRRLNALLGLAEAAVCRRHILLNYFGDSHTEPCGNCDLCKSPPKLFDGTEAAQKAFSAVLRTGEYFGTEHLISVLRGDANERVKQRGHDRLPTFGVGKERSKQEWQGIFLQLMGHDLLRPDPSRHGALRLNESARPVLRGEKVLMLRADTIQKAKPGQARAMALVPEEDEGLLAALKAVRRGFAEAANVPGYIIFNDRTLIEMVVNRPSNLDEMRGISGVGAVKLERYGKQFLEVIQGDTPETPHPARQKIAGRDSASLFDRLQEAQTKLANGSNGVAKPLSCNAITLKRIAEVRPQDMAALERISGVGAQKAERFGEAFLGILNGSD